MMEAALRRTRERSMGGVEDHDENAEVADDIASSMTKLDDGNIFAIGSRVDGSTACIGLVLEDDGLREEPLMKACLSV